jgi:hypothetical protein
MTGIFPLCLNYSENLNNDYILRECFHIFLNYTLSAEKIINIFTARTITIPSAAAVCAFV